MPPLLRLFLLGSSVPAAPVACIAAGLGLLAHLLLPPDAGAAERPVAEPQHPVVVPTDNAYYTGINEHFGRWPDGVVRWSYNPGGAPARYRRDASFVPLVKRAMQQWGNVCGIRFEYVGTSSRSLDDDTDGVVMVEWNAADPRGAAAWAGPSYPSYFPVSMIRRYGYVPFVDGVIVVNSRNRASTSQNTSSEEADALTVAMLAHEIGHLIGLGHSDDPASILYANPYSHFRTLRDDDVDAAQALYGPPENFVAPERFAYPGAAEPIESLRLSVVDDSGTEVSRVTRSTRGPIWLKIDYGDGLTGAVEYKIVDEDGYVVDSSELQLACQPRYTCGKRAYIGDTEHFVVRPGNLQLYVFLEDRLLDVRTLRVEGRRPVNRMPSARLEVDQVSGKAPLTVTAQLAIGPDPEGDRVSGTWHVPGYDESGFSVPRRGLDTQRQLTFGSPGRYEIFVSLTDDAPRYGDPGSGSGQGAGFRKLLSTVVEVL